VEKPHGNSIVPYRHTGTWVQLMIPVFLLALPEGHNRALQGPLRLAKWLQKITGPEMGMWPIVAQENTLNMIDPNHKPIGQENITWLALNNVLFPKQHISISTSVSPSKEREFHMMEQNSGNVPASQNQIVKEWNLAKKNMFISNFIYQTSIPVNEKKKHCMD